MANHLQEQVEPWYIPGLGIDKEVERKVASYLAWSDSLGQVHMDIVASRSSKQEELSIQVQQAQHMKEPSRWVEAA